MLRKLLQGLAFGSGFGLAFVAICTLWITWFLPRQLDSTVTDFDAGWGLPSDENIVTTPPPVLLRDAFLGSTAIHAGGFEPEGVLAGGDGAIKGRVTVDGRAIEGVRLRLAVNGSVMSQWAMTNADGVYSVAVPFGEYRLDGYELDHTVADNVLAGKISHPTNPHKGPSFRVEPNRAGEGLTLDFIDPIVKKCPRGEVSLSDEIIATWEPVPGAATYTVQLYESEHPQGIGGLESIFDLSRKPVVSAPRINLKARGAALRAGYHYSVEILASDKRREVVSATAPAFLEMDFKVVE